MIDQRDRLKENPFSYEVAKSGKIRVFYKNKMIMNLSENDSMKLMKKLNGKNDFDTQLILAKVTGNFKRGNERRGK